MLIYNITTNVETASHEVWLQWMRQVHIPNILGTGKFSKAKMTKVLTEAPTEGHTYSVQFTTTDHDTLRRYYQEDAPALRKAAHRRFGDRAISFRTELEVVDEYQVNPIAATHLVFTYGTLQDETIQKRIFSRVLKGVDDHLPQYRLANGKVADRYPNLEHTRNAEDTVKGRVYTLAAAELQRADAYEGAAYQRIAVTLASGKRAWAYMASNT